MKLILKTIDSDHFLQSSIKEYRQIEKNVCDYQLIILLSRANGKFMLSNLELDKTRCYSKSFPILVSAHAWNQRFNVEKGH